MIVAHFNELALSMLESEMPGYTSNINQGVASECDVIEMLPLPPRAGVASDGQQNLMTTTDPDFRI